MNAFPPMLPHSTSGSGVIGHGPKPPRKRARVDTIILPLEAGLARRICLRRRLDRPVATAKPPEAREATSPGGLLVRWLAWAWRVIVGAGHDVEGPR